MRRKAQQYQAVAQLLKTFKDKEISTELQVEVREIERHDVAAAGRGQGPGDRAAPARRPAARRRAAPWQKPMVEVLKAIDEAPDAVRDRFAAWQKAKADPEGDRRGAVRPGDVGLRRGPGHGRRRPEGGRGPLAGPRRRPRLPHRRRAVRAGATRRPGSRASPGRPSPATPDPVHRLELLTRIVQLMPPPRHDAAEPIDKTTLHRVLEDENAEPTEYAVRLPPEYHPLRSYPALVVLHSGPGPAAAIDEWAAEAARHGYILIAPEYNLPGQPHDYRYTTSEHAAVELALRDARKRYAIDSDRVFVAGQLIGGNMAWDYALAHPDLFAGVVVFSGLPAKYVPKYLAPPRAAAAVLRPRRAGPRGQRGHLHQATSSR